MLMLTKNNFTTEAIVAKYVTTVNNLANERGVNKPNYIMASNEMEVYSPHQQLIAMLWFVHEGCPENHPFMEELSEYKSFYRKDILSDEEFSFLLENYATTIEYLFSCRRDWSFRLLTDHETPSEIAEVCSSLIDIEEGKTLYVPFCGYGDLAIKFPKCKFWGYTKQPFCAVMAQIRLSAQNIEAEIVTRGHERKKNMLPNRKVDAIICDVSNTLLNSFYDEDYNLENLYDCLTEEGCMIALCANQLFTSDKEENYNIRRTLIEDKTIESIIQLPEGLYDDTRFSPLLLCIDKQKRVVDNGGVVMYNASFASRGAGINSELKRIDVERFLFAIQNANQPELEEVIRRVSYNDIEEDVLLPGYYLLKRDNNSKRKLTDLVTVSKGKRKAPEGKKFSYSIKGSLTPRFSDARLSLERVDESSESIPVPGRYYLCHPVQPCIFLTVTGDNLYIGYSDKSDDEAFYRVLPTVMCLQVNEGISVEYVTSLLFSKEIKEQITSMSAGSVIRRLDSHLLSKVVVPEHTKEQMSLFLEETLKATMSQREKDMQNERKEYERGVRLRKHALSQSVSSFSALFNALNKCRQRQNGVLHDSDKISPISEKTVGEVFETLSGRMVAILEKLAHIADIDIDFGEPENIDPEKFILDYIKSKKGCWVNFKGVTGWYQELGPYNQETEDLIDPDDNKTVIAKAGEPLRTLKFPKKALEHIFDNIVSNAQAHGFLDDSRSDYKVRFSWEEQGPNLVITVENNGKPLSEEVNPNDILSFGYSTMLNVQGHNGIGGSEIASIMRDNYGDVSVISCPNSEYTVKYVLTFYNTNAIGKYSLFL